MDDTSIVGCRSTKIYCRPDCPAGKHMKPENRVQFVSREEARSRGYRACKVCKPDDRHETFSISRYHSPLGTYLIVSSGAGLICVEPEESAAARLEAWHKHGVRLEQSEKPDERITSELDAYFAGRLSEFTVPLDLRGSDFQRSVWQALLDIPYGQTCTYGDVAKKLGKPTAPRAVGGAIGSNPVSIVVPCHRVVGASGDLTGYGGGLPRKKALLALESATLRKKTGEGEKVMSLRLRIES